MLQEGKPLPGFQQKQLFLMFLLKVPARLFFLNGLDKCIVAMLYPFGFTVDEIDYLMFKDICKRKDKNHADVLRTLIANFVNKPDKIPQYEILNNIPSEPIEVTLKIEKELLERFNETCKKLNVQKSVVIRYLIRKYIKNNDSTRLEVKVEKIRLL